ncbi:MAG: hypothetical protein NW217_14550 [Hyphomicrobiaceae bacterium]|nr:hypothetical protein [Hyphomicrobiaceae bacterium]
MAEGDLIPDDQHVLRHVPGSKIAQDGRIDGSAFVRRLDEAGLSVEWRESAGDPAVADQVARIRRTMRRDMRTSHRLAELPVGPTKSKVHEGAAELGLAMDLTFEHAPLEPDGGWPADPYHSEIFGTPEYDDVLARAIGDILASCVSERYSAVE